MGIHFGALGLLQKGTCLVTYPSAMKYDSNFTIASREAVCDAFVQAETIPDSRDYLRIFKQSILIATDEDRDILTRLRRLDDHLRRGGTLETLPNEDRAPITYPILSEICLRGPKYNLSRIESVLQHWKTSKTGQEPDVHYECKPGEELLQERTVGKPEDGVYKVCLVRSTETFDIAQAYQEMPRTRCKNFSEYFHEILVRKASARYLDIHALAVSGQIKHTREPYFLVSELDEKCPEADLYERGLVSAPSSLEGAGEKSMLAVEPKQAVIQKEL